MNPIIFALITAAAWGIGGYFEKQGMRLGQLSPQVGITIRTGVALVVLAAVSFSHWSSIAAAGAKPLLYMILGGGIVAGSVGMLCFYAAIREAPLARVMPIAFTAPLFGAAMGVLFGGETLSFRVIVGAALCVGGIALLSSE
jgi:transporter family protein